MRGRKEDTTLTFDVFGKKMTLWVHYMFYPRVPATRTDDGNPDYIEIEQVIHNGRNITDLISLISEDFFSKLEEKILARHE